ncbi:MAG TPA: hypothetical protein VFG69_01185 [Nannocystaceae bacterium]|nr:hypothetical protein [Nannocystaceae bacterium]
MVLFALVLALVGPPKLPPIGGRSIPPPEAVVAKPVDDAATKTPTPQPPPAKTSPAATPAAETVAKPPVKPAAETVAKPAAKPAAETVAKPPVPPAPTSPTIGPATAPADPSALRVVAPDEIERWAAEDRARAEAKAARTDVKVPKTPAHDGPVLRTASEEPPPERLMFRRRPHPPKRSAAFVLGYRHFRINDALQREQDWHLASLEVTPLRRYVRLNLITEFGVEGGEAARAGDRADMMLMERLGLGVQYPHFVTPLVEFQGGVGGARVELFQRNDLAFLYTLGVDAGVQIAITKWMYLHTVVGWIRPTFRWPDRSASYDRFSFKVGIGF